MQHIAVIKGDVHVFILSSRPAHESSIARSAWNMAASPIQARGTQESAEEAVSTQGKATVQILILYSIIWDRYPITFSSPSDKL